MLFDYTKFDPRKIYVVDSGLISRMIWEGKDDLLPSITDDIPSDTELPVDAPSSALWLEYRTGHVRDMQAFDNLSEVPPVAAYVTQPEPSFFDLFLRGALNGVRGWMGTPGMYAASEWWRDKYFDDNGQMLTRQIVEDAVAGQMVCVLGLHADKLRAFINRYSLLDRQGREITHAQVVNTNLLMSTINERAKDIADDLREKFRGKSDRELMEALTFEVGTKCATESIMAITKAFMCPAIQSLQAFHTNKFRLEMVSRLRAPNTPRTFPEDREGDANAPRLKRWQVFTLAQ